MLRRRTTAQKRRITISGILAVVLAMGLAATGNVGAQAAASTPPAPGNPGSSTFGLTVSWSPTTAPVQATRGETATGKFWVTNTTKHAIPVQIRPAIAVPGNNGQLSVRSGIDKRFSKISYTPNTFTARPDSTTAIRVTVTIPDSLGPGIYLIPGVVHPQPPAADGGIHIEQDVIAPVTFQIPGAVNANLTAAFLPTAAPPHGTVAYHFPGLPEIEIGPVGTTTLRVTARSTGSLYAYGEVTAKQHPFGTTALDSHTPNLPTDLRLSPVLFFPGVHRDYPIAWRSLPLGVGLAHLSAYVSYDAGATALAQKSVATQVLLVSPWWLLSIAGLLALLLIRLGSGARSLSRPRAGRRRRVRRRDRRVGSTLRAGEWALLTAATVAVVPFGAPILLAVVGGCGIAVAVTGTLASRRRGVGTVARGLFVFHLVSGVVLVTGVAALVMAAVTASGPMVTTALALLASSGLWGLAGAWVQRSGSRHRGPGDGTDVLVGQAEPAPGRSAILASGPAADGTPSPETVL